MSSFLSELGGITAGVGAEGLAFAAGFAASHALEPEAVTIRQDAWQAAQVRRLDALIAAEIAAEDIAHYDVMQAEATYSGIEASRFAYLYHVNLIAPGTGELLNMLRRGTINGGNFTHGLRKNKLEPMWDDAITNLQHVYLSPDILAVMLQRNVIPNQGQLPGITLDTTGRVPRFPHVPIDAYSMAQTFGWSNDQLDAQTRIQGLPPGMDLVARMVYRNIVDRGDFNLAAEQSNRRVEWADYEFDGYRQILTAEQSCELQLRGYINRDQRLALTRLHGMSDADSDLLYDVLGRGLNLHAAFIAERRGGVFNGPTDAIPAWALWMLERGNLRPETYNLAWAGRETLPSAFVIRALLTDGAIDESRGETLLLHSGWAADLAALVAQHYAAKAGTAGDPHAAKAATQLWTTTHSAYKATEIGKSTAQANLSTLGIDANSQQTIFTYWDAERSTIRHQISVAQLLKAEKAGITNPATGKAYTNADVVTALVDRGYTQADATVIASE